MDRFLETTQRRRRTLGLIAAAFALFALFATLGPARASAASAQEAAQVRSERQAANRLAAQHAREERAAHARLVAEERRHAAEERRAHRTSNRVGGARVQKSSTALRVTPFGTAEISCSAVTFRFTGFPATGLNTVKEFVYVEGDPVGETKGFIFTFTGETATNTITLNPEEVGKGRKRIDALVQGRNADDATFKGGFDIVSSQECGNVNEPGFAIEKTQTVAGSNSGFHTQPIVVEVGQTIEYQIKVTNTGNTVMTFGALQDPNCDPGTIKGEAPGGILVPGAFERITCTHAVTATDLAAGTYTNIATITGTPNGSEAKEQSSKQVVAEIVPVGANTGKNGGGGNGGNGGNSGNGNNSGNNGSSSGNTGTSGTLTGTGGPRQGTLGATSASVPLLSAAPAGCVRSSFLVRVRASGVRTVVVSIDGHRLKTLSAHAARHGYFTVRVTVARLGVGRHKLQVRITMQALTASRHHVAATRSLSFLRCASVAVHPHFTG
jgi:hypothetical protein